MPPATLQQVGDRAIWSALERAGGRVQAAARLLGVPRSSLQKALATWAAHLAPAAEQLRAASGYSFGRPVELDIHRDRFVRTWESLGGSVRACALELGVDRYTVRRLAVQYGVPGAPRRARAPRKP